MDIINGLYYRIINRISEGSIIWNTVVKIRWILVVICSKNKINYFKMVEKNKELKDIHKGERCFILGNAPSLNDIEFSKLENEIVFTTNMLMKHEKFNNLKSNYHVIVDGALYGITRSNVQFDVIDVIKELRKLENNKDMVLFLSVDGYEFAKQSHIDRVLDIRYLYNRMGHCPSKCNKIDLSSASYYYRNVILSAISIAIYMGFEEIYLLGCELSYIENVIQTKMGKDYVDLHAYKDTNIRERESYIKNVSLLERITSFRDCLVAFQRLSSYCKENNIIIKNLSSPTLIDCIERDNFSNIIA